MVLKNFIVFEGIDGAGTSTQIDVLKNKDKTSRFFLTAEPTELPTGKFLRQILKKDIITTPETTAYLFAADRNEHIYGKQGIQKQINNNKIVVSDRYFFSSLAYQGIECSILPFYLNKDFPLPQILFYFDIQPEESLKRIESRTVKEIYEKVDFLNQVVTNYKKILKHYENTEMKIVILDATKTKEEISKIIWAELSKLPIINL